MIRSLITLETLVPLLIVYGESKCDYDLLDHSCGKVASM